VAEVAASESVRELTSAIAAGDAPALARLYRAWFDFALQEAHRCTARDEHFCLDAVQETMLRVIRRLPPLDTDAALAAWMRTAVRSACVDLLRRDLRRSRRERRRASDATVTAAAATDDPAAHHEVAERLAWLRRELATIDATSARALDLRFRLGWTLARIGETLHLRTGAVDGRIHRTIEQLRASAQEDSHD